MCFTALFLAVTESIYPFSSALMLGIYHLLAIKGKKHWWGCLLRRLEYRQLPERGFGLPGHHLLVLNPDCKVVSCTLIRLNPWTTCPFIQHKQKVSGISQYMYLPSHYRLLSLFIASTIRILECRHVWLEVVLYRRWFLEDEVNSPCVIVIVK